MTEKQEELTVYECRRCWSIIPYPECPHNCPVDYDDDNEDDGFGEDMATFLEEIKGQNVNIVEAPAPEVLELIADLMTEGQEFQSFHIREDGEEVPEGVEPIPVYEVDPGLYRPISEIMAEAEEVYQLNFAAMNIHQEDVINQDGN